jgi:hypothetical protein
MISKSRMKRELESNICIGRAGYFQYRCRACDVMYRGLAASHAAVANKQDRRRMTNRANIVARKPVSRVAPTGKRAEIIEWLMKDGVRLNARANQRIPQPPVYSSTHVIQTLKHSLLVALHLFLAVTKKHFARSAQKSRETKRTSRSLNLCSRTYDRLRINPLPTDHKHRRQRAVKLTRHRKPDRPLRTRRPKCPLTRKRRHT